MSPRSISFSFRGGTRPDPRERRKSSQGSSQLTQKKSNCYVLLTRNQWFKFDLHPFLTLIDTVFFVVAVAALITHRIIFHSVRTCHFNPSPWKSSKRYLLFSLLCSVFYSLPKLSSKACLYRARTNPPITVKRLSFWPIRWWTFICPHWPRFAFCDISNKLHGFAAFRQFSFTVWVLLVSLFIGHLWLVKALFNNALLTTVTGEVYKRVAHNSISKVFNASHLFGGNELTPRQSGHVVWHWRENAVE